MAYVKTTWETGDVITAEKLNNMEDGIEDASALLIITVSTDADSGAKTMDKTFSEILEAYEAGIPCAVYTSAMGSTNFSGFICAIEGSDFSVAYMSITGSGGLQPAKYVIFNADTAEDYPYYIPV